MVLCSVSVRFARTRTSCVEHKATTKASEPTPTFPAPGSATSTSVQQHLHNMDPNSQGADDFTLMTPVSDLLLQIVGEALRFQLVIALADVFVYGNFVASMWPLAYDLHGAPPLICEISVQCVLVVTALHRVA